MKKLYFNGDILPMTGEGDTFEALVAEDGVIAFTGSMGMGKTAFTRGLVEALGGDDVVSSPTFALVNEYEARLTVQHFDMYRVSGWDDLYSTGFFDYLDTGSVLVIEWSENIDGALPDDVIRIDMQKGEAETERIIAIDGIEL